MGDQSYDLLDPGETEPIVSEKSETECIDLTSGLNLSEMHARVWYLEAGHDRKGLHRHESQEELYVAVQGNGRMQIDDETITVPEGATVRVSPETPRRVFNDTDAEHVWLIVGAPPRDDGRRVE